MNLIHTFLKKCELGIKKHINYKLNSPDAYSFLIKVSLVANGVIPISRRKGSNMNPLLIEYIKTPSVVAAAHDKPNLMHKHF